MSRNFFQTKKEEDNSLELPVDQDLINHAEKIKNSVIKSYVLDGTFSPSLGEELDRLFARTRTWYDGVFPPLPVLSDDFKELILSPNGVAALSEGLVTPDSLCEHYSGYGSFGPLELFKRAFSKSGLEQLRKGSSLTYFVDLIKVEHKAVGSGCRI